MIDIKKAIELFKHHDLVKFIITYCGEREYKTDEFSDIVKALEKQIPKTIEWSEAHQSYFSAGDEAESFCSGCGEKVNEDDNFCHECGQALDWSECL